MFWIVFLGMFDRLLGSFMDFAAVEGALQGVYGAWVNTDGFTVGEEREVFAGIKIFEIAKRVKTLKHYVYSSLDYSLKVELVFISFCFFVLKVDIVNSRMFDRKVTGTLVTIPVITIARDVLPIG